MTALFICTSESADDGVMWRRYSNRSKSGREDTGGICQIVLHIYLGIDTLKAWWSFLAWSLEKIQDCLMFVKRKSSLSSCDNWFTGANIHSITAKISSWDQGNTLSLILWPLSSVKQARATYLIRGWVFCVIIAQCKRYTLNWPWSAYIVWSHIGELGRDSPNK